MLHCFVYTFTFDALVVK